MRGCGKDTNFNLCFLVLNITFSNKSCLIFGAQILSDIQYNSVSVKICRENSIFFKYFQISSHFYEDILCFSIYYSEMCSSTMRMKVALLVNWSTFKTPFSRFATNVMQETYRDWNTRYGWKCCIIRALPPHAFPVYFCLHA